jgi:valyl-tRNA synthetase
MPFANKYDETYIDSFGLCCDAVQGVRGIRQQKGISPKVALNLKIKGTFEAELLPVLEKLANVQDVDNVEKIDENAAGQSFIAGTTEFFVPLEGMVDNEAELAKAQAELERYEGFLAGVNAKLCNAKFVEHAPAQVVEVERKKQSDAEQKIEALKAIMAKLGK